MLYILFSLTHINFYSSQNNLVASTNMEVGIDSLNLAFINITPFIRRTVSEYFPIDYKTNEITSSILLFKGLEKFFYSFDIEGYGVRTYMGDIKRVSKSLSLGGTFAYASLPWDIRTGFDMSMIEGDVSGKGKMVYFDIKRYIEGMSFTIGYRGVNYTEFSMRSFYGGIRTPNPMVLTRNVKLNFNMEAKREIYEDDILRNLYIKAGPQFNLIKSLLLDVYYIQDLTIRMDRDSDDKEINAHLEYEFTKKVHFSLDAKREMKRENYKSWYNDRDSDYRFLSMSLFYTHNGGKLKFLRTISLEKVEYPHPLNHNDYNLYDEYIQFLWFFTMGSMNWETEVKFEKNSNIFTDKFMGHLSRDRKFRSLRLAVTGGKVLFYNISVQYGREFYNFPLSPVKDTKRDTWIGVISFSLPVKSVVFTSVSSLNFESEFLKEADSFALFKTILPFSQTFGVKYMVEEFESGIEIGFHEIGTLYGAEFFSLSSKIVPQFIFSIKKDMFNLDTDVSFEKEKDNETIWKFNISLNTYI